MFSKDRKKPDLNVGSLVNVAYPFIAIVPSFTLTQNGST